MNDTHSRLINMSKRISISAVIPTYRREKVLLNTIDYLLNLNPTPDEILIVDQTPRHESATARALEWYESEKRIRWIRLPQPSITHAMNTGLERALGEAVLFLDDDIIPHQELIAAHIDAHGRGEQIVAGQVLQPGELPVQDEGELREFQFVSGRRQYITELMGGNFSIRRNLALRLGGFDENFVHVAYRFEAEFAGRALAAGGRILFEPQASIRHLKAGGGGTRSFGHHLKTIRPSHSVGAYYFLLRSERVSRRLLSLLSRPFRAVRTKHHFIHPWWIPATLAAEVMGFFWAVFLYLRGPRLLGQGLNRGR